MNERLEQLLAFFVAHFPRTLTRTEIVKLVYLFEYHYTQLYGTSYCDISFARHNYGPHCAQVVQSLSYLQDQNAISILDSANYFGAPTYLHVWQGEREPRLDRDIERIARFVIQETKHLDLQGIKGKVYGTPPMHRLLQVEAEQGYSLYGEVIDMATGSQKRRRIPISRLRVAFRSIDRTPRGVDEEYRETISREYESLRLFRKRANRCPI